MKKLPLLALLSALVACTGALHAAPPVVTALPALEAPDVDGVPNDSVWQRGEWYGNFSLLDQPTKLAVAQTRFKVAADDRNLYLAVQVDEPNMDQLVADTTQRDGHVYSDDCVEFMLAPRSERQEYYHLAVNTLGTLYDAERRQGGHVGTLEWNCDWRAAVSKGPQSWTVEVAIPLVELGVAGDSKGDWTLNVTRERQAGQPELSSFAPSTGGFHQPSTYAALKLIGVDLSRYMWTVRPPYEASVYRDGERLIYSAKTHLTNETGKFWFTRLRAELLQGKQSSAGTPVTAGLDTGQSRELAFAVPVREQGEQTLRLTLVDRRDPAQVLCIKTIPVTLQFTPLAVEFTKPNYRDCIYATQKLERIEFRVTAALPPAQLQGTKLQAVLYPRLADGSAGAKPVTAQVSANARATTTMSLPAGTLAEGDYLLRVALVDARGQKLFAAEKRLRKLPPPPGGHEWRLDEQGVLLHNGEPFLPFGWFSQALDTLDRKDGYTAVQSYSYEYFPDDEIRRRMDEVAQRGFFITFSPYSRQLMNRDEEVKHPLSAPERDAIVKRVTALMDHPGLLAWYMADEPELRPELPQRAQELYEACRDTDPYHPCIMLNDTLEGIRTYARGGDILMPDPYPCFLKGGLAASPIEKVSKFMDMVRESGGGRTKGAWITPQGFNYGDYGKQGQRGPNLTELRNMQYQSVIHGAKGFLWYTHSQIGNYPDLSLGMPFLAREAADLKTAILGDNVEGLVTVQAAQPEHMHVGLRRVGGQFVLMAVNTATEPQEVTFTWKGGPNELSVVSEGRRVALRSGSFTEKFGVYATHLYATNPALELRESLTETQSRIDAANSARKVAGNLAFEDSEVAIKVSSGSTYGNTPERVVDGVRTGMGWQAKNTGAAGDWVELTWPAEIEIGRVALYSRTLTSAALQVPGAAEGEWRTVGEATGTDRVLNGAFAPVKTRVLRVFVQAVDDPKSLADLQEVEVYAK